MQRKCAKSVISYICLLQQSSGQCPTSAPGSVQKPRERRITIGKKVEIIFWRYSGYDPLCNTRKCFSQFASYKTKVASNVTKKKYISYGYRHFFLYLTGMNIAFALSDQSRDSPASISLGPTMSLPVPR